MSGFFDPLLILVLLTNLDLLRTNRIGSCIRTAAVQGWAVGFLFLATSGMVLAHWRVMVIAVIVAALKGVAFPVFLVRTQRVVKINREVEPYIGFPLSVLVGVLLFGVSFWVSMRLPLPEHVTSSLAIPVGLTTMLVGFLLLITRRKAITQVIGYLVLENGIAIVGGLVAGHSPFLVELGILLDVFLGVFVMGIAVFQISREFNHIDADRLSELKD